MRIWRILLVAFAAALAVPPPAHGQTFPPDRSWIPLPCAVGPMVDAVRDQTGAVAERDVVGNPSAPAGFRASDGQFLYLRLRVDDIPTMGANLRPFAWGFAFSVDGAPSTYEVLITLDGVAGMVTVYHHSSTALADSPADPAEQPPAAAFPLATHARTQLAPDTNFGGNRDYFVDMAVPWTALASLSLVADRPVVVWGGTSSRGDRLDGDLACHDAGGTTTVPSLSASASAPLTPASTGGPAAGAGGAGGASGAGGLALEGGPGCTYLPGSGGGLSFILLAVILLLLARWRRDPGLRAPRRAWGPADGARPDRRARSAGS
jgi:hypothetical protein